MGKRIRKLIDFALSSLRPQKAWICELERLTLTHKSELDRLNWTKKDVYNYILITLSSNDLRTRVFNIPLWYHHWNAPAICITQFYPGEVFLFFNILYRTPSCKLNPILTRADTLAAAYESVRLFQCDLHFNPKFSNQDNLSLQIKK